MKLRLFLTCWIVFSLHFATNVVREHYPAFTLIERGDFVCDRYAGFHSDIFKHTDGHWYIGNNVMGSVIAAVPLVAFDPVLDALEDGRRAETGAMSEADTEYDTEYPNRARFFRLVRKKGLDLRFGASAAITSVFLMAPLSAFMTVLMFLVLARVGCVREGRAAWLALLFAFSTPVFYRAAYLNHNVFLLCVVFGAFLCVWRRGEAGALSFRRRFWGGFLSGMALALDYAGVVPLLVIFGYLLVKERSFKVGIPFVLGSIPPVLFLLASQWGMYGDAFLPGQFHMADVNYTAQGWRGFGFPDPEVFFLNLFSLDYGFYTFAPLLLLGLIPARLGSRHGLVLPTAERRLAVVLVATFLVFQASNQYSRMQWNTGLRYLLPLVPLVFLQAADWLNRMPTRILAVLTVPAILHGWVLSMHRYIPRDRLDPTDSDPWTVVGSWRRFLDEGVDFPWLRVLRNTPSVRLPMMDSPLFPYLLLLVAAGVITVIWRWPRRQRPPVA